MQVEGLIVRNGGAEHPLYTNFRRFWRGEGGLSGALASRLSGSADSKR